MERKHKITIPEPCHESWDKMMPSENGRFCMSCSKTVIDFTTMLPDEVQHFFIQNQNNRICGRFKNEQLESLIIQIPSQVLYTQTNYHKMFLLALFIAMGTTLFSCADKDGNKKKIDKVEVVQDVGPTEHISVGKSKITNSNNILLPPPPPPKVDQVKFVKPTQKKLVWTTVKLTTTAGMVIASPIEESEKTAKTEIDSLSKSIEPTIIDSTKTLK